MAAIVRPSETTWWALYAPVAKGQAIVTPEASVEPGRAQTTAIKIAVQGRDTEIYPALHLHLITPSRAQGSNDVSVYLSTELLGDPRRNNDVNLRKVLALVLSTIAFIRQHSFPLKRLLVSFTCTHERQSLTD